jgi:hypothetical protein
MKIPKYKPSARFLEDYAFYLRKSDDVKAARPFVAESEIVVDAPYWFWLMDTHGIRVNCADPLLAARLIEAKANVNLTVKMWAEDLVNCLADFTEVMIWANQRDCIWWMFNAAIKQAQKIALATIGFVPTRLQPVECHARRLKLAADPFAT